MIEDHSHNNQSSDSQGKLVLPAVSLDHHSYDTNGETQQHIQIRHSGSPQEKSGPAISSNSPFARLRYYWRSSPAHQFLIIAVSFATVVGFIFAGLSFAQPAMLQANQLRSLSFNQVSSSPHAGSVTATPSHGVSNTTHETPTPTPTPSPTPEPTVEPTPTVAPLSLQITSAPTDMDNDTSVDVTVQTSQPGVPVHLILSYTKATGIQSSKTHQTDNNGMVTFHLHISVVPADDNADTVKALLMAVAEDQNHPLSQSQPVSLIIHIN